MPEPIPDTTPEVSTNAVQRHPVAVGLMASAIAGAFWGKLGCVFGRWGDPREGHHTAQKLFGTLWGIGGAALAWDATMRATEPVVPLKPHGEAMKHPPASAAQAPKQIASISHEGVVAPAVHQDRTLS